jgi:hypothetical protein
MSRARDMFRIDELMDNLTGKETLKDVLQEINMIGARELRMTIITCEKCMFVMSVW